MPSKKFWTEQVILIKLRGIVNKVNACYPKGRLFWNGWPIFQGALKTIIADVLIKSPLARNCGKTAFVQQRNEYQLRVRIKCLRERRHSWRAFHTSLPFKEHNNMVVCTSISHCVLCIYHNFYNSPWCTFLNTRKVEFGEKIRKIAAVIFFLSITCFQSVVGRP